MERDHAEAGEIENADRLNVLEESPDKNEHKKSGK